MRYGKYYTFSLGLGIGLTNLTSTINRPTSIPLVDPVKHGDQLGISMLTQSN